MIVPGQHEPIISERLFYEVQDVLEGKKRKDLPSHISKKEDLPLRGYFKCTACGKNLTGSASKGNGANASIIAARTDVDKDSERQRRMILSANTSTK
jgi:hypothetical protein